MIITEFLLSGTFLLCGITNFMLLKVYKSMEESLRIAFVIIESLNKERMQNYDTGIQGMAKDTEMAK